MFIEDSGNTGRILAKARLDADISQAELARRLGIDKRTVQRWESGDTWPSLDELLYILRKMGLAPDRYIYDVIHPHHADINAASSEGELREAAAGLMYSRPLDEVRIVLLVFLGNHGHSARAALHMTCMYLHLALSQCVAVCYQLLASYRINQQLGVDACPDHISPDVELVQHALDQATKAAIKQQSGYSIKM